MFEKNPTMYTQTDIFVDCKPSLIEKSSNGLLKFRIGVYCLFSAFSLLLALELLTIDYSSYEDPRIKRMERQRYTLLTAWMNILHLLYYPLCIYIDWKELNGRHFERHVIRWNKFRHFLFTAIIFPSTLYVDAFFWRVWNIDRELIVPNVFDILAPMWAQHGMHTITFITCMFEILAVPRFRPVTVYYHTVAIKTYLTFYLGLGLWEHNETGHWPYPFFEYQTPYRMALFGVAFITEYFFMFYVQWWIIDIVWGHRRVAAMSKLEQKFG